MKQVFTSQDPHWPDETGAIVETEWTDVSSGGWRGLIFRVIPALDSLRTYSWRSLGKDSLAGFTVATVAVPQAMAYASIIGVPPQYGLYTAIVMTAVGALFDSSKQLINGPTNAISIALLSAMATTPTEDRLAIAMFFALLIGLFQTAITLLRLGDLTRYISHAVIVGFTFGASTLLILDQLKHLLGQTPHGAPTDHFLKRFWMTSTQGGWPHLPTTILGGVTILMVLALRRVNLWLQQRRYRFFIPEFLVAVVIMAVLVWGLGLNDHGVRITGEIPARLPSFEAPRVTWELLQQHTQSALAIAMLGLLEAIAMAKAIAAQTGQKLDINQQCLSEGLANLAGSCFQCFPGSGSLTRSAINQQSGAVSQWSGVISAAAVAGIMLLFAPLAQYIPKSTLAGLLILTGWRMIDRAQLAYYFRATRFDMGIVLATALAAVVINVEFCILIGVFLSFVLYVPRAAGAHLTEYYVTPDNFVRERAPADPACDRILLFNLEGELFFGSSTYLEMHFATIERKARAGARVVILRTKRVRNIDAVCLHLLETFIKRQESRGIIVLLCGVRQDLARALRAIGLEVYLGPKRIFPEAASFMSSTVDAYRHAYTLIGEDRCNDCPHREPEADARS